MEMTLHASQDDFTLHANADTPRGESVSILFAYELTDPQGNTLTDPQGNTLIGYAEETFLPQILHATPDDFYLHAE